MYSYWQRIFWARKNPYTPFVFFLLLRLLLLRFAQITMTPSMIRWPPLYSTVDFEPRPATPPMSTFIGIREVYPNGNGSAATISETNGSLYSPAKEKAAARGFYNGRSSLFIRRLRKLLSTVKLRLLLGLCIFCVVVWMIARLSSLTGWIPYYPSSSFTSISRYNLILYVWIYVLVIYWLAISIFHWPPWRNCNIKIV